MAEKKVNTNFLWIILVLATAVVVFTVTNKLAVIPVIIPETHADLISVVALLFFLIVLILYVPTTAKKRKKTRTVEVMPISNSEEIVFSQVTEEEGEEEDELEIREFRFPFHPDKDVYAETTMDVGEGRSLTLLCEMT